MNNLTLHKLYVHAGLVDPVTALTLGGIQHAIISYFEKTGEGPNVRSGDASKWFGFQITWGAVNHALYLGYYGLEEGFSLLAVCQQIGLSEIRELTPQKVVGAVIAYHRETGCYPSSISGDASKWFGFQITWVSVNHALLYGYLGLPPGGSLARIKKDLGVKVESNFLSKKDIETAIRKYLQTKGRLPSEKSGGATEWFGFQITWQGISRCLGRKGETSLYRFCVRLELRPKKGFTLGQIKKGIQAFFKDNRECPNNHSGDASKWMGYGTWGNISSGLSKGYWGLPGESSLHKLCIEMGLK